MASKTAKKPAPKVQAKPKPRVKAKTKVSAAPALECGVCGYRVIVDEACGCVEEHVLICCGHPMAKK